MPSSIARIPLARRQQIMTIIVAIAALAFPLVHDNDADIDSAANAASFAILALGLNIVVGFAGLLDLGYAAFFAIGAYAYGILTSFQVMPPWTPFWEPFEWLGLVQHLPQPAPGVVHFTVSFWIMLPVSALIAAGFGVLFGAPTLRLRGDYLAIVTLGFGEIVPIVVRNVDSVTNGAAGLNGIQAPKLFGISFGIDAWPYYYVGITLMALLMTRPPPVPWASIAPAPSCWPSPSVRPSPAPRARCMSPNCKPRRPRCSASPSAL
jgi:branched-chain amino acid transport system permease protein